MGKKLGLVQVYTGDGKGKTSAAIGLVTRAVGQGYKAHIIQFMKGGAYTGEMISAKNFLPCTKFVQYGRPCIKEVKQMKLTGFDKKVPYFDYVRDDIDCGACRWCFLNDKKQQQYIDEAYAKSKQIISSGDFDIVVLDEINIAVDLGFLSVEKVLGLIASKAPHTELVLTGRNARSEIIQKADLVTEMRMIKHYFQQGIGARRGIEY
jgi:cob(I)alamin adenosyltransferase